MPSKSHHASGSKSGHGHKSSKSADASKGRSSKKSHSRKEHHSHSKSRTTQNPRHDEGASKTARNTSSAHKGTSTSKGTSRRTKAGPSSSLGPDFPDPVLIAVIAILGISTIILFVIGVWLLAVRNGWPVGLNLTGNENWTRTLSYGTACVILAILFVIIIILALIAGMAKRGGQARVTRLGTVFCAALAALVLILMTFTSIFFATNSPPFIADIIREGWVNTVTDEREFLDACSIQNRYGCEGWELNSCKNCKPTVSGIFGNCSNAQKEICPRCYTPGRRSLTYSRLDSKYPRDLFIKKERLHIRQLQKEERRQAKLDMSTTVRSDVHGCREFVLRRYREFFIPFSVYTIFLCLLLVLLSWKTCIDSTYRT